MCRSVESADQHVADRKPRSIARGVVAFALIVPMSLVLGGLQDPASAETGADPVGDMAVAGSTANPLNDTGRPGATASDSSSPTESTKRSKGRSPEDQGQHPTVVDLRPKGRGRGRPIGAGRRGSPSEPDEAAADRRDCAAGRSQPALAGRQSVTRRAATSGQGPSDHSSGHGEQDPGSQVDHPRRAHPRPEAADHGTGGGRRRVGLRPSGR